MVEMPKSDRQQVHAPPKRGLWMAVTAFALGILAISHDFALLTGPVAIVLGLVVLITRRPGKWLAIAGLVIGTALLWVNMTHFARNRELARRAMCGSNLHRIGQALAFYQSENDDAFPPDLQHLIDTGPGHDAFVCPLTGHDQPFDYFYLPPAKDAPGETMTACDFKGNHEDGRSVLYADSHVKRLKEAQFQQELAKPHNAAFAAALRAAEAARQKPD